MDLEINFLTKILFLAVVVLAIVMMIIKVSNDYGAVTMLLLVYGVALLWTFCFVSNHSIIFITLTTV